MHFSQIATVAETKTDYCWLFLEGWPGHGGSAKSLRMSLSPQPAVDSNNYKAV